jgi:hypothetical protein
MTRAALLLAALLAGLPLAAPALAQGVPADSSDVDEAVLENLSDDEISGDPTALLEFLEGLRENPLDINRAGAADLAQVPALSAAVAREIVRFREAFGLFGSIPELRAVEGVTDEVFLEARPYLTIGLPLDVARRPSPYPRVPTLAEVRADARVDVLQRVQRRLDIGRGYDPVPDSLVGTPGEPTRYAGSPERIYTRLRATYRRNLSANLTLEKDPGEPFEWDPGAGSYGYDFASFHLAALQVGRLDALVLGDFGLEFGQGLALWRASGFGKGRESVRTVVKRGRGVRPYGSADENNFFRGAAATVAVTPWLYASAFGSRRTLDASFLEVDTTEVEAPGTNAIVSGLAATGLHRTPTERARKDALGQTLVGGAVEARRDRATVGLVAYSARFDEAFAPGTRPYQRFDFTGDEATMASAYANVFLGRYQLFGEVARAPRGVFGGVGGVEAALGPIDFVALGRHYPRDFVSLHGYAFGERNGVSQNESGLYLGLRLRPAKGWLVSGFFDQYRFPWVRFTVPRPARGHEALLFVQVRPRTWVTLYAQGRTETREASAEFAGPTGAVLPGLTDETRQSLRVQGEFVASRALRFRARVEGTRYHEADGPWATGMLVFQDVRWSFGAFLLDARLTFFDTEGFDARLYQFENDLLGVFANTLLFGRGTRAYALLAFRPGGRFDGLDLRAKLAETRFQDRRTVGSGLDEVEGDRVRDLSLQLRYRF